MKEKDIYKWWSKKALKNEILKLKLTYNELFDAMLRTQEENRDLRKEIKIIDDANVNLRANNKDLREQLNDRSYVRLEQENADLEEQKTALEAKNIELSKNWRADHDTLVFYNEKLEKENKTLEGCLLAEQEHTLMLEKQIEKMMCCENCAYRTVDLLTFKPFCDKRKLGIENPLTCKCDKWKLVN